MKLNITNFETQEKIIDYYTKFIINTVKTQYNNTIYDKEILIEAGVNGLLNAINNYNQSNNLNIYNKIKKYIKEKELELEKENNLENLTIQQLAIKMINGNSNAREKIIDYYTNHIKEIVDIYYKDVEYNKEELIKSGIKGLMHSIEIYKIDNKRDFSTLVSNYIHREIKKTLNDKEIKDRTIQKWAVKMINGDFEARQNIINYYTNYIVNLIQNNYKNYNYDKEEIIQNVIVSFINYIEDYKKNVIDKGNNQNIYFCISAINHIKFKINQEINKQNRNSNIDYIGLNNNYQDDNYNDFINSFENNELLKEAIKKLSKRNKEIIYLYFYKELTLEQISQIYNVSRCRAHQLLHKSLTNIKKFMMVQNEIINIKKRK